jgi:MOSC domain-containing protein YiiM
MSGVVREIYLTAEGGAPMEQVPEVQAVAGRGLEGDRYAERKGYWTNVDECQVTLIEEEGLDEIRASTEVQVSNGEHRRNIITRGVRLLDLVGRRFKVGEATFEFDRPRPPCRYIQSRSEHGMTKALGRNRGGICARVVQSGAIRAGDAIDVLDKENTGSPLLGR